VPPVVRDLAAGFAWESRSVRMEVGAAMRNKPQSAFAMGQRVRVVLNERNRTPHTGTIRDIIWHFKQARYSYYLEEVGKKVSKRYFEEDLEPLE
jgi:hypothetical protein